MIVANKFPRHETKKKLRNSVIGQERDYIKWPDVTIHTKADEYASKVEESSFSILSVNGNGNAHIVLNKKELKICNDTFFMVGPFEHFNYTIDHGTPVEVLNFHLGIESYQDALAAISLSQEKLLDEPMDQKPSHQIIGNIHFKPEWFKKLLHKNDHVEQDLKLLDVVEYALKLNAENNKLTHNIKGTKNSTKKELYRRMAIARDMIFSQYDRPGMDLEYLSSEVYMSKFHFLRVFKQTFGITPYQMIRNVRINKIHQMVNQKHINMADIAILTGINEPNTIYSLYKEAIKRKNDIVPHQPNYNSHTENEICELILNQ